MHWQFLQLQSVFYQRVGKWSKLWATSANALGSNSTSSTGMNYPYMRYAEILLIYAEAG